MKEAPIKNQLAKLYDQLEALAVRVRELEEEVKKLRGEVGK